MENKYGLDTNILIYYLTGKPEEKHKKCLQLIKSAERGKITIKIVPVILWEATWILEKFYENKKQNIVEILKMFLKLDGIECDEKEILIKSFNLWEKKDIDFADAYIINKYKNYNILDIYSYDHHLKNKDINCLKPEANLN